ncbi:hypothetical protein [Xanthobacter autotrophicus]|uniref:hypothetical protein n=1 Tax=Xanthobacter autotrophicus TaxID=280 RepID=UPI003727727E
MSAKADEMIEEAKAIRRLHELAEGVRAIRSEAKYHGKRALAGAARLEDGARALREKTQAEGRR